MPSTRKSDPRPHVGVEIMADRVIAARATKGGNTIDTVASRTLAPGALTPALAADNIHERSTVSAAIREALEAVGDSSRDVALVLPDASTRISLLDFDTLPEKRDEADGVVRFRLRKALPFDIDRAALSYDVQRGMGGVRVVAAVVLKSVLDEYEQAVRDAGYAPGIVLPSMAAALGAVDTSRPTLVVKFDHGTSSLAIASEDELLLLRTLELPADAALDAAQIADDVYPSLVFFEDTYKMKVERMLVGGAPLQDVSGALEQATGLRPHELVPAGLFSGTVTGGADRAYMGGVVGALIG